MGKLDGKVAFITGAARGQGRSHAVRLARGRRHHRRRHLRADRDRALPDVDAEDLDETVNEVEALGRRIVARRPTCVTRRAAGGVDDGVAELGPVDIVLANAGIAPMSLTSPSDAWQDVHRRQPDRRLRHRRGRHPHDDRTGPGRRDRADELHRRPHGSAGQPRRPRLHRVQARRGRPDALLRRLAPHNIRVNTVHPTGVNTPMIMNETMQKYLAADPYLYPP